MSNLNKSNTAASAYESNLAFLASATQELRDVKRGIEKEGLRVDSLNQLALTSHPKKLGSAMCNSWLTTDFSESLLEFITPTFDNIDASVDYLETLHALAYSNINAGESIWGASMPCKLPADKDIPLAQFGDSNIGTMKTTYRRGLGNRYGRAMQTVAGIHYNFSLPTSFWEKAFAHEKKSNKKQYKDLQDYINQRYFALIRNFRRNYWILVYLFGAAPCVDKSFLQERPHSLESLNDNDFYLPNATSLRMGDLGYQSEAQKSLFICYNELDNYIKTLGKAIRTPYPGYQNIDLIKDGEHQQLSDSLLQIENEFYSPIRPKRITNPGETPLQALSSRGIEYIEIRCLDINPNMSVGIDEDTMRFLDTFLLHCLIKDSPDCDREEFDLIGENQTRIVNEGRDPHLMIYCGKTLVPMRDCAVGILNEMVNTATQFDRAHDNQLYTASIAKQRLKVHDVSLTPSAQVLNEMVSADESHLAYTARKSAEHKRYFERKELSVNLSTALMEEVEQSLKAAAKLGDSDTVSFEQYLEDYFEQSSIP